jgi:hypothetical protein
VKTPDRVYGAKGSVVAYVSLCCTPTGSANSLAFYDVARTNSSTESIFCLKRIHMWEVLLILPLLLLQRPNIRHCHDREQIWTTFRWSLAYLILPLEPKWWLSNPIMQKWHLLSSPSSWRARRTTLSNELLALYSVGGWDDVDEAIGTAQFGADEKECIRASRDRVHGPFCLLISVIFEGGM